MVGMVVGLSLDDKIRWMVFEKKIFTFSHLASIIHWGSTSIPDAATFGCRYMLRKPETVCSFRYIIV